jgi:Zn-dependent peptidase ImmA (M78 family)
VRGRKLKNYDKYLEKIEHYAQACEITIKYGQEDGDGSYSPARRTVKIDENLSDSAELATLLHELGHVLDDSTRQRFEEPKLSSAYNAVYNKKPTKKQIELVLECEEAAWVYARAIAKKLRIPLGKWFDDEMKDGLDSYRETETQNR